jgi:Hypothetical protein (DUF2513)
MLHSTAVIFALLNSIRMQRDLELIRHLMLEIESKDDDIFTGDDIQIGNYNLSQINRHLQWLVEANLVDGKVSIDAGGGISNVIISKLSWEGCSFLDNARNESVWKKTMETVKEKSGTISFTLFTQLLISVAKQNLGLG